jgi:sulfopyruvate decarboxylase subunit alpha
MRSNAQAIYAVLREERIAPCVVVPCKTLVELLTLLEHDSDRALIYPTREEEGLGICAGAYLAGAFPMMVVQNSGLGNMINAYCSLNRFFDVPVLLLISHRGSTNEPVAAQRPMGEISKPLLDLLGIENRLLDRPDQIAVAVDQIRAYRRERRSRALLLAPEFWR